MNSGKTPAGRTQRTVAIVGTRGYPSYYGGFETAVRKLAPYLADHGWNVRVYGRRGTSRVGDPQADRRVTSITTPGIESKSLSTLSYGLTSALHAIFSRTDVVLVMNVANGFWLPLFRWRRIPTLINVDGMEWERAKWGKVARQVFIAGARLTARFGDRLVYDSRHIRARWLDEFGRDGDFIPYGGDQAAELAVPSFVERRKYVLFVARFVPENSTSAFFGAAERLAPDVDVVIVGSSGYSDEFDRAAAKLDRENSRIHWLGHVSDDDLLFALWSNAGVYFHGHSVGGTNPALVQALALGAPVIARDTVYNREVIGGAGVLVEATPDVIESSIRALLSDSSAQEALSLKAVERARAEYSWEAVNQRYMEALEALLRAGGGSRSNRRTRSATVR